MGEDSISALGFADDVVLCADRPESLQRLLDICQSWSLRNGVAYNIAKCKVLVLNTGKKGLSFKLNGVDLVLVDSIKYLGVTLSRTRLHTLYNKHITNVLEKATTRQSSIRHLGYHKDGFRP